MRGNPCSSVYCGSICEGICSAAVDICGAIGVTTSGCWSVGVMLVSLFSIYFFGFRFDLFLPLERCEDCGSISKPFFFIVICKHLFSYGSDFIYLARTSPPPPISKRRATSIRCRTGLVDFYFNVKQQRISCVRLHASSKDKLEQSLCTQPAWITSA